jgi:signal transduction histidine kinase
MQVLSDVLRWATDVLFVALGAAAVLHWRRRRGEASGWLAGTFGVLAAIVLVGIFLPQHHYSGWQLWLTKLLIAALVLFPYMLYRFAASFARPSRAGLFIAGTATAVVVGFALALPSLPARGEPRGPLVRAFVIVLLVQWTGLTVPVTVRLWRSGRGQPSVARRRMQLLGAGAALIALALLASGLSPAGAHPTVFSVAVQLLSMLSAPMFYLGFLPPAALRTIWRAPEDAAIRAAQLRLVSAAATEDVARTLLPHAARLVGGAGAALFDRRREPIASSLAPDRLDWIRGHLTDGDPGTVELGRGFIAVRLRSGVLAVEASPYTPFFGRAEVDLLADFGFFADLKLERVELYERERLAREAAERANAELESFVYSASHDLRSPLITMLSYLEYLRTDMGENVGDQARRYMDRMAANARYMDQLIADLLELSGIGRTQTDAQDVGLSELVNEVAEGLRLVHPQVSVADGELGFVRLNPLRARQLLTNLLENAATHGGRPDVHVRVRALPGPAGFVELVVADDGCGIPPQYRDRVFGVFVRLVPRSSAEVEGTGIGLAICKKIVEQSGGRIWIGNEERGAEFHMTVPVSVAGRDRKAMQGT